MSLVTEKNAVEGASERQVKRNLKGKERDTSEILTKNNLNF